MNLSPYQLIVPLVAIIAIIYAWNLTMRQKKSIWEAFLWTVFWGIIALIAIEPGLLAMCFFAFAIIAYWKGLFILSAFCMVIAGSTIGFLWYNIIPAKFYMGDTGAISLGATLGVIAMMTDSVFILPIIASRFIQFLPFIALCAALALSVNAVPTRADEVIADISTAYSRIFVYRPGGGDVLGMADSPWGVQCAMRVDDNNSADETDVSFSYLFAYDLVVRKFFSEHFVQGSLPNTIWYQNLFNAMFRSMPKKEHCEVCIFKKTRIQKSN
jgi:hypothetical protein